MITWKWGEKYKDKNVNDIPTEYLEWVKSTWKSSEAKELAGKALSYREGKGGGEKSGGSEKSGGDQQMLLRAMCLIASAIMTPQNPWRNLLAVKKYVGFNELPKAGDLGPQSPKEKEPDFEEESPPPTDKDRQFDLGGEEEAPF